MPAGRGNGIKTLDQLREMCDVEERRDGCWLWQAGFSRGRPTCRVLGQQIAGPKMTAVALGRDSERQADKRWTVRCGNAACIAPHHLVLATVAEMMAYARKGGRLKRTPDQCERVRAAALRRDTAAPEWKVRHAIESVQPATEVAAELQVTATAVKQWRRGRRRAEVVVGPWAQLLRAAA